MFPGAREAEILAPNSLFRVVRIQISSPPPKPLAPPPPPLELSAQRNFFFQK